MTVDRLKKKSIYSYFYISRKVRFTFNIKLRIVGIVLLKVYSKEINITAHKERINKLLSNNNIDEEKDIGLEDKNPNVLKVKKIPEVGYIYDEYDENKLVFVMDGFFG